MARIDTGSRELHDSRRRVANAGARRSDVRCAGANPWSGNRSALLLRAICNRWVQKRSGGAMKDEVTSILSAIERGDPRAAERLLPLVYDELRRLAAQRLAQEKPGQTLQPTALVHEAYLRLVGSGTPAHWDGCGHFFAAAAEAMRRILVEQAQRKKTSSAAAAGSASPPTSTPCWPAAPTGSPGPARGPGAARRARPRQGQAGGDAVLRRSDARSGGRVPGHRAENSRPRLAVRPGLAVHRHGRAGFRRKMNGWWHLLASTSIEGW